MMAGQQVRKLWHCFNAFRANGYFIPTPPLLRTRATLRTRKKHIHQPPYLVSRFKSSAGTSL